MWFDSWSDVLRVLLVGPASYAALVVLLRTSGKRTLAKLNAFDLIVTVALGSTLATIFLSKDVSWTEGVVALGVLAVMQLVVATLTSRVPASRSVLTAHPTMVFEDGAPLEDALRDQRLSKAEVWQAIRSAGVGELASVAAVVLEADGTLSVISTQQAGSRSALQDVDR